MTVQIEPAAAFAPSVWCGRGCGPRRRGGSI